MQSTFKIGFLNIENDFLFEGGQLLIDSEFLNSKNEIDDALNPDGHIYPRTVYTAHLNLATNQTKKVLRTDRPQLMRKLPCSHKLVLNKQIYNSSEKREFESFVLHCFFLFIWNKGAIL